MTNGHQLIRDCPKNLNNFQEFLGSGSELFMLAGTFFMAAFLEYTIINIMALSV